MTEICGGMVLLNKIIFGAKEIHTEENKLFRGI